VLRNQTGSLPRSNYCQPDTEMQGISEKLLNETQNMQLDKTKTAIQPFSKET
jgi:hypothetical protein